jgi:hypothetical protein
MRRKPARITPYNNSETKFNKAENWTKWRWRIVRWGCFAGSDTEGVFMRHINAGYVTAAFIAVLAAAAAPPPSRAETILTPAERCTRLSQQVTEVIRTHAPGARVNAARALQKRGDHLCSQKKRAQGIRSLAKALKQLGAKPVDID